MEIIKATKKQKEVFKEVVGNHSSVHAAMKKVYRPATAKNPKNLTNSKGWKELMDKYISEDLLAKKHNKFLNSKKEDIGIRALDLGYKLKGLYAAEKHDLRVKELPQPIMKLDVLNNNSDKENIKPNEKDQSSSGGNIGVKDDLNPNLLDSLKPKRQD